MEFNLSNVSAKDDNNKKNIEDVVILGSGPAGLSAALYAARAEMKPLVLTGLSIGGQVALTHTIENYPGFPEGVGGVELGNLFQKQAENFGARIEYDQVSSVDLSSKPYKVETGGNEFYTKSIIVSTGADPNHLNVPGEKELTGRGVSYCATCDGWFFKDKDVVVVGGGDSALEESIFLTRFAKSVKIIHRRDELRAGVILEKRAKDSPKISFIWDTVVNEIVGSDSVTKVNLQNVKTKEESSLDTDGVFIFIGHKPNTTIFEGQLEMDDRGYLVVDNLMRTSVPGVFAAGEVADPTYRQVVTSAGMGASAAMQLIKYLENEEE